MLSSQLKITEILEKKKKYCDLFFFLFTLNQKDFFFLRLHGSQGFAKKLENLTKNGENSSVCVLWHIRLYSQDFKRGGEGVVYMNTGRMSVSGISIGLNRMIVFIQYTCNTHL